MASPAALLLLAAFWPVWPYLFARWGDGSDEPCGILALICLAVVTCRRRQEVHPAEWTRPAALGAGLYAALIPWAPKLVCAGVALATLAAVGSCIWAGRLRPSWLALALFILPVLASAQFYLGYPMRVVSAEGARFLLGLSGTAVAREGVTLGGRVFVDRPCSGLNGLWSLAFLVAVLGAVRHWNWLDLVRAAGLALVLGVAGNALRVSSLFILETTPELRSAIGHSQVGAVTFGLSALALVYFCPGARAAAPTASGRPWPGSFLLSCMLAGLASCITVAESAPDLAGLSWPVAWQGSPLRLVRVLEVPRGFPGRAAEFHMYEGSVTVRQVVRPTRFLHSAADCLKASGRSVRRTRMGCLVEGPNGLRLLHEVILDSRGREYKDVSSWYWAAVLGRSVGPWTAYSWTSDTDARWASESE